MARINPGTGNVLLEGIADPESNNDAANKEYVDNHSGNIDNLVGGNGITVSTSGDTTTASIDTNVVFTGVGADAAISNIKDGGSGTFTYDHSLSDVNNLAEDNFVVSTQGTNTYSIVLRSQDVSDAYRETVATYINVNHNNASNGYYEVLGGGSNGTHYELIVGQSVISGTNVLANLIAGAADVSNVTLSAIGTHAEVLTMVGATSSDSGAAGLVPQPVAGDQVKFLRGDGTWQDTAAGLTAGAGIDITSGTASVDLATDPGLEFTGTGNARKLRVDTDESTLTRDSTNGVQIMDGGVDTTQLASDAVTAAKIASNAVTSAKIADNNVTADELNVTGDGDTGQVLSSDGDGSFSWIDIGYAPGLTYTNTHNTGTWTVDTSTLTAGPNTVGVRKTGSEYYELNFDEQIDEIAGIKKAKYIRWGASSPYTYYKVHSGAQYLSDEYKLYLEKTPVVGTDVIDDIADGSTQTIFYTDDESVAGYHVFTQDENGLVPGPSSTDAVSTKFLSGAGTWEDHSGDTTYQSGRYISFDTSTDPDTINLDGSLTDAEHLDPETFRADNTDATNWTVNSTLYHNTAYNVGISRSTSSNVYSFLTVRKADVDLNKLNSASFLWVSRVDGSNTDYAVYKLGTLREETSASVEYWEITFQFSPVHGPDILNGRSNGDTINLRVIDGFGEAGLEIPTDWLDATNDPSTGRVPVSAANNQVTWTDVNDVEPYVNINSTGTAPTASGTDAIAIGEGATAGAASSDEASIAIGRNASADENRSIAIGDGATADVNEGLAIGLDASATGNHSAAIGYYSEASEAEEMRLGNDQTHVTIHSDRAGQEGQDNQLVSKAYVDTRVNEAHTAVFDTHANTIESATRSSDRINWGFDMTTYGPNGYPSQSDIDGDGGSLRFSGCLRPYKSSTDSDTFYMGVFTDAWVSDETGYPSFVTSLYSGSSITDADSNSVFSMSTDDLVDAGQRARDTGTATYALGMKYEGPSGANVWFSNNSTEETSYTWSAGFGWYNTADSAISWNPPNVSARLQLVKVPAGSGAIDSPGTVVIAQSQSVEHVDVGTHELSAERLFYFHQNTWTVNFTQKSAAVSLNNGDYIMWRWEVTSSGDWDARLTTDANQWAMALGRFDRDTAQPNNLAYAGELFNEMYDRESPSINYPEHDFRFQIEANGDLVHEDVSNGSSRVIWDQTTRAISSAALSPTGSGNDVLVYGSTSPGWSKVDTANIDNDAITTDKLATDAVTTVKITDANVTTAKLANDAVTQAKIADNAVGTDQVADNTIGEPELRLPTTTSNGAFLLRDTGSDSVGGLKWAAVTGGTGTSGQVLTSDGDGTFTWAAASGGGISEFSSTATYDEGEVMYWTDDGIYVWDNATASTAGTTPATDGNSWVAIGTPDTLISETSGGAIELGGDSTTAIRAKNSSYTPAADEDFVNLGYLEEHEIALGQFNPVLESAPIYTTGTIGDGEFTWTASTNTMVLQYSSGGDDDINQTPAANGYLRLSRNDSTKADSQYGVYTITSITTDGTNRRFTMVLSSDPVAGSDILSDTSILTNNNEIQVEYSTLNSFVGPFDSFRAGYVMPPDDTERHTNYYLAATGEWEHIANTGISDNSIDPVKLDRGSQGIPPAGSFLTQSGTQNEFAWVDNPSISTSNFRPFTRNGPENTWTYVTSITGSSDGEFTWNDSTNTLQLNTDTTSGNPYSSLGLAISDLPATGGYLKIRQTFSTGQNAFDVILPVDSLTVVLGVINFVITGDPISGRVATWTDIMEGDTDLPNLNDFMFEFAEDEVDQIATFGSNYGGLVPYPGEIRDTSAYYLSGRGTWEDASGSFYVSVNSNGTTATATGTDAVAIGELAIAAGTGTVAIGQNAQTNAGAGSVAIGPTAEAMNTNSIAIGNLANEAVTAGESSICIGVSGAAPASGSIAIGRDTSIGSTHTNSVAIGRSAATTTANQVILGASTVTDIRAGNSSYSPSFTNSLATRGYVDSAIESVSGTPVTGLSVSGGNGAPTSGWSISNASYVRAAGTISLFCEINSSSTDAVQAGDRIVVSGWPADVRNFSSFTSGDMIGTGMATNDSGSNAYMTAAVSMRNDGTMIIRVQTANLDYNQTRGITVSMCYPAQ